MTTTPVEVYSLEEGDNLYLNGEVYYLQLIEPSGRDATKLWLVDEEGFQSVMYIDDDATVPVVVLDNYAEV